MYLKIKCGVGYHLRRVLRSSGSGKLFLSAIYIFEMFFFYSMSISDRCETEKISSLVEQHVPKAKLSQQNEAELTFTLPFESMDTFPGKNQTVFMGEGERGITLG